MIDKISTKECCICHACSNVCPVNAIHFDKEEQGFRFPEIDYVKCIKCNRCESVCPSLKVADSVEKEPLECYAMKNMNLQVRKNSTSGGMFYALAEDILDKGGYVCGAVFKEDLSVKHILINKKEDLGRMCGSKYVQSDVEKTFIDIKHHLKEQKEVLFCGCPCQIAGLKSFLGEIPENLYLIDLVCHGIPGDIIFQAYMSLLERKKHSKIKEFKFRDKTLGWHRSAVKVEFENGSQYLKPITVDAYMNGFLSGITLKESCYKCKFKHGKSGSDLTLGDFWGAEIELPEEDDNIGLSAVLVNTEKGKRLVERVPMRKWKVEYQQVVKYNKNIVESTRCNPARNSFFAYAEEKGYDNAICDLLWEKPLKMAERKLKYILRYIWYKVRGREKPLY